MNKICGNQQWRLPTVVEIKSRIGVWSKDTDFFPNARDNPSIWTSSRKEQWDGGAWVPAWGADITGVYDTDEIHGSDAFQGYNKYISLFPVGVHLVGDVQ